MERSTEPKATSDGARLNRVQMARALREGAGAEDGRGAEQRIASAERKWSMDSGLRRVGASVTLGVLLASTLTGGRITALRADFLQHAAAGGGRGGSIPGSPGPSVGSDGKSHSPIQDTNQEQQKKMFSKLTGVTAAIAVGTSVTVAGAQNAAVQWRVSDGGNGHWYQLHTSAHQQTWFEARDIAVSKGGYLATATSASEARLLGGLSMMPEAWSNGGYIGPWLGGYQDHGAVDYAEPSAGWRWVTNEPWSFTAWDPIGNQPSNGRLPGEDFLHLSSYSWTWNDLRCCDGGVIASIIEWSADCNNDNIVDYGQCHDGTLPDYNGDNVPDCCDQGQACVLGHYPVQWRVEDGGNGHWYQPVISPGITWQQSRSNAQAAGGDLVTIGTAQESAWIFHAIVSDPGLWWSHPTDGPRHGPWIGLFQDTTAADYSEPAGGWKWIDGTPAGFTSWSPSTVACENQPSDCRCNPAEGCGMNFASYYTPMPCQGTCGTSETWTAAFNDMGAYAVSFVIEWSADCNHDNIVDYGQILSGQLTDTNGNGVPNVCESTVTVPGSYATIQAAIDATPVGTARIIEVAAGTYPGPIDFKGRNVVVHGAGAGQTILGGTSGQSLSVVRFSGGEPATAALEAVTVRGGLTGTPIPGVPSALAGGGIFGIDSAASVRDCMVENNVAGFGAGMYFLRCSGEVRRTTVRNNTASSDGGGFQANQGSQRLTDVVIEGNTCNSRGGGMHLVQGTPTLTRVTVRNNYSNNLIGGISWYALGSTTAMAELDACAVSGNSALVTQGGIGISAPSTGTPAISLHSTNVCGNAPRPNVSGPWTNLGGNTICDCVSDLNLDGVVNGADMGLMLSSWGPCGTNCPYDLNTDGQVNGADLGVLLSAWGTCGG